MDYTKPNKDVLLGKILLGLPFHGVVMQHSQIQDEQPQMNVLDSSEFGTLVSSGHVSKMEWDKTECEHLIELENQNKNSIAIYPTKRFFKERLDFSKTNNLAGVAIWDIAQGLESFLDEF